MNNEKNKKRIQLQSWCNPLLFAQLQSWDIHIFVVNIWIWISKWSLQNATLLTNIIENISTNLSKPNSWADMNNVLLKNNYCSNPQWLLKWNRAIKSREPSLNTQVEIWPIMQRILLLVIIKPEDKFWAHILQEHAQVPGMGVCVFFPTKQGNTQAFISIHCKNNGVGINVLV